jgi:hypothetical protein
MLAWWVACFAPPRPPGLPAEAPHVVVSAQGVTVDGAAMEHDNALVDALVDAPVVWVEAADLPWRDVRDVRRAIPRGVPWWFGSEGPLGAPRGGLADDCTAGHLTWSGTSRVYALHLWESGTAAVATPTVRFRPIVDLGDGPVAVEGLPITCWAPPDCASQPAGPLRTACEDGRTGAAGLPSQLLLAPAEGSCLSAWTRGTREAWREEWGGLLARLGPRAQDESIILPTSSVPAVAVGDAVSAFSKVQRPLPIVSGIEVEGGHPMEPGCADAISAEPMLALAEAYWLGERVAEAAAH